MMDEQQALTLACLAIEERIAAAEKEWLRRAIGTRRASFSVCTAWAGGILVRIGHRLEVFGGATHAKAEFEVRQAV